LLADLETFLAQYGHRESALAASQPTWKDKPEIVFGILKALSAAEPQASDEQPVWQRTRDELLAHSPLGWPLVRPIFLRLLMAARRMIPLREDTHFYATLAQPIVRRVALELGRRLVEQGVIDSPMDVFHLKLEELQSIGDTPSEGTRERLRALVAQRKAKRESLGHRPLVDARAFAATSQTPARDGVLVSGTPGSPGVASGPARIVRDGSEFGKLQPGDVLVAPYTNPSWTPLFQRAAAVVVDTGGAASHAAIVAREYGVPAVMGTRYGTQQLHDGEWVQVDGSRGLVLRARETN
jgi:pyruvate,water dikinase